MAQRSQFREHLEMPRTVQAWTVKQCDDANEDGRYRVSQSLYLIVGPVLLSKWTLVLGPNGDVEDGPPHYEHAKRWAFRYTKPSTGRVTECSLGAYADVTLAQARAKVRRYQKLVRMGIDPLERRQVGLDWWGGSL
jgi:hypothetical protein